MSNGRFPFTPNHLHGCDLLDLSLSAAVSTELNTFMPGAESCLERHEWYKHGTCSGISADAYFALSNGLVASFAQTEFNQYIASQIGRDVARNDLLDRFEAEFGAGSWVIPSFPAIHRANSHQQRPF